MLQSKKCTHISIKKHNKKSLSSYCSHYQMLFINTILNIDKLTNLSESILKIKSAKAKLVKNTTSIVNNTVDISALLKQNTETECNEEKY